MATDRLGGTSACAALIALGLLLSACAQRSATPVPAPNTTSASASERAVDDRLTALDAKIANLEQQFDKPAPGTSSRGALVKGSSLRIGGGDETVLERLRRLEQERNAARAEIQVHTARIASLTTELSEARSQGKALGERADYLSRTQESLVAAQQTLSERTSELEAIKAILATSELQRLRGEREYYLLAATVLKLGPDQLGALPEIQERIRTQVQESSNGK